MSEAAQNTAGRAYNLTMTASAVEMKTDVRGKEYIKATVDMNIRGRAAKRTVIAQGKAVDMVKDVLVIGQEAKIRCLFSNYVNDDGEKGGEFLTVVGLPETAEQREARKAA